MTPFRIDMAFLADIHTHRLPAVPGSALYSLPYGSDDIPDGQLCSAGFHPWDTCQDNSAGMEWVARMAGDKRVAAIGECGLDRLRGAVLPEQVRILRYQIELSEKYGKPLILHLVRLTDQILSLHSEYRPRMPWLVHGFRRGADCARQLLNAGIFVSFGTRFNRESMLCAGLDRLLLETDDSGLIQDVATSAAAVFGLSQEQILKIAAENAEKFLYGYR